jgi:hypothetical protein
MPQYSSRLLRLPGRCDRRRGKISASDKQPFLVDVPVASKCVRTRCQGRGNSACSVGSSGLPGGFVVRGDCTKKPMAPYYQHRAWCLCRITAAEKIAQVTPWMGAAALAELT